MTFAEIADRHAPTPEIVGPYSDWPRRPRRPRRSNIRRRAAVAAGVAAAGISLHCGLPFLF